MKLYISFGTKHIHTINGYVYDANVLAEIDCDNYSEGRRMAFELFDSKFSFSYLEEDIEDIVASFPRGVHNVNKK
jgi:hypothetical protein